MFAGLPMMFLVFGHVLEQNPASQDRTAVSCINEACWICLEDALLLDLSIVTSPDKRSGCLKDPVLRGPERPLNRTTGVELGCRHAFE